MSVSKNANPVWKASDSKETKPNLKTRSKSKSRSNIEDKTDDLIIELSKPERFKRRLKTFNQLYTYCSFIFITKPRDFSLDTQRLLIWLYLSKQHTIVCHFLDLLQVSLCFLIEYNLLKFVKNFILLTRILDLLEPSKKFNNQNRSPLFLSILWSLQAYRLLWNRML